MKVREASVGLWAFAWLRTVASAASPIVMPWNTKDYFGPDGPWQAVSINIGEGKGDRVSLYPGGSYGHKILTTKMCNGTDAKDCLASKAGLYDFEKSDSNDDHSITFPVQPETWHAKYAMNITGYAKLMLDEVSFRSADQTYVVEESAIAGVFDSKVETPDGNKYPTQVGSLALGAQATVQNFSMGGDKTKTANLLLGDLFNKKVIPSYSYGLHIGSVSNNQPGSLVLGGYDISRTTGDFGTWDIGVNSDTLPYPIVPLIDVTLGAEQGDTPFSIPQSSSLYNHPNSSIDMIINPTIPYIHLPFGMCEAIAEHLPVTWKDDIGLYTWNTEDDNFEPIVKNSAFMSFTFGGGATNTTIKVPFRLLNLTLTDPIVQHDQAYFPCKPTPDKTGYMFLGRAFLQAAYMAINWDSNGAAKLFLAQATGPSSGSASIKSILPTATDLPTRPLADFAETWKSTWGTAPNSSLSSDASTDTTSGGGSARNSSSSSGLSTGAKAGIAVACVVIALAVIAGGFFFWRRRKSAAARAAGGYKPTAGGSEPQYMYGNDNGVGTELYAPSSKDKLHQQQEGPHEMGAIPRTLTGQPDRPAELPPNSDTGRYD